MRSSGSNAAVDFDGGTVDVQLSLLLGNNNAWLSQCKTYNSLFAHSPDDCDSDASSSRNRCFCRRAFFRTSDVSLDMQIESSFINKNAWFHVIKVTEGFDISNIEIGNAATGTKVKDDHQKLILEAKTILKNIVRNFSFINPKTVSIHSMQLCGFKRGPTAIKAHWPKENINN